MMFAALALAAAQPLVGTTLSYVRSNIAGGEEETVLVHRRSAGEVAVAKLREKCTRAALVTATIDPVTGEASKLIAARLQPEAKSAPYGTMTFDPQAMRVEAVLTMDGQTLRDGVSIVARPWHLYDYDLATLAMATAAMPARKDFSFGLALAFPGDDPAKFLSWLGKADAKFVRAERHEGRAALRYEVTGAAQGPLWLDAVGRYPIDVQWKRPNHPGYDDFRLRLTGTAKDGEAGWTRRLSAHFTGCPKR